MKKFFTNKLKNFLGFTLIELLVVIAIISVLSTIGLSVFNSYTQSTKEAVCKENHRKIIEMIKTNHTMCKLKDTITLKRWYSGHKQGADYNFNCSSTFFNLAANTGIHMTNFLKNAYETDVHWGYSWIGNTGIPNQNGRTYYSEPNSSSIRLRTLCNNKVPPYCHSTKG